jgi:hypothetical protein
MALVHTKVVLSSKVSDDLTGGGFANSFGFEIV